MDALIPGSVLWLLWYAGYVYDISGFYSNGYRIKNRRIRALHVMLWRVAMIVLIGGAYFWYITSIFSLIS